MRNSIQVKPITTIENAPNFNDEDENQRLSKPKHEMATIMKFFLITMRLFGFHHEKSDKLIFKTYSIIILSVLWINFIKMFSTFNIFYSEDEPFSADLVLKIITLVWIFECSCNATIIYINESFASREPKLIEKIKDCLDNNEFADKIIKKSRLYVNIMLTIAVITGVFNEIVCLISIFGPKEVRSLFILLLAPFQRSSWAAESVPFRLFNSFMFIYLSMSWSLCLTYYITHCQIIIETLKSFNERMSKFIGNSIIISNEDQGEYLNEHKDNNLELSTENEFEQFRLHHLKICSCIKQLDTCYNQFIGMNLLSGIPIICILLYTIADWTNNCITGVKVFAFPFWLLAHFVIIFIIIWFAAKINTLVVECIQIK
jgi:hypothetical protein